MTPRLARFATVAMLTFAVACLPAFAPGASVAYAETPDSGQPPAIANGSSPSPDLAASGAGVGETDWSDIDAVQAKPAEAPETPKTPEAPRAARTVGDGLYELRPAGFPSLRVSAGSGAAGAGRGVQLASGARYRLEQAWRITWKGDGYEISNARTGRTLDTASRASNTPAAAVQGKRPPSASQRWAIERAEGGYRLVSMATGTHLAATRKTPKAGCGLALALPSSKLPGTFRLREASVLPTGPVRLFPKAGKARLCAAMPECALANGARVGLAKARDRLEERFVVSKSGGYYTIQAPCSGKLLTARGKAVVQLPRNGSRAQRWTVTSSDAGGLQLVNAASKRALALKGRSGKAEPKLVLAKPSSSRVQCWRASETSLLPPGLYELRPRKAPGLRLGVEGGSVGGGANAAIHRRSGNNGQKFAVLQAGNGYCRISKR